MNIKLQINQVIFLRKLKFISCLKLYLIEKNGAKIPM